MRGWGWLSKLYAQHLCHVLYCGYKNPDIGMVNRLPQFRTMAHMRTCHVDLQNGGLTKPFLVSDQCSSIQFNLIASLKHQRINMHQLHRTEAGNKKN